MAELCLECFNQLNGTNYKSNEVCLEEDFCEGCGEWKPCVSQLQPKRLHHGLVKRICALFQKDKDI